MNNIVSLYMNLYNTYSGDVAFRVLDSIKSVSRRAMQGTLPEVEEETQIYICDINPNMLSVGKKRAADRGKIPYLPSTF